MKFITADAENPGLSREALVAKYTQALQEESIEDLQGIIESISEDKNPEMFADIKKVCIENIIRMGIQLRKNELCQDILETHEVQSGVRLEYFKSMQNYIAGIFCINKMIGTGQSYTILERERECLRKNYRMKPVYVQEYSQVKELPNDIYSILWRIYSLIVSTEIDNISCVQIIEGAGEKNEWGEQIIASAREKYLSQDAADSKYPKQTLQIYQGSILELGRDNASFPNKSGKESGVAGDGPYEKTGEDESPQEMDSNICTFDIVDCIAYIVERFLSMWSDLSAFHNEKYSLAMCCLTLLDYMPVERLSRTILGHIQRCGILDVLEQRSVDGTHQDRDTFYDKAELVLISLRKKYVQKMGSAAAIVSSRNGIVGAKRENISAGTNNMQSDPEIQEVETMLMGYLVGEAEEFEVMEILEDICFLDLQGGPLYFRVLEKGCSVGDAGIVLFCLSVLEWFSVEGIIDLLRQGNPTAQSYFLAKALYSRQVSEEEKNTMFESISTPIREFFTFPMALYLLSLSSGNTHLSFFSHFMRHREIVGKHAVLLPNGETVYTSGALFGRALEMVKKYLKKPNRMYLSCISDTNTIYAKLLNVFRYKKDYKSMLAINPFDAQSVAEYIKQTSTGLAGKTEKLSILQIYEICKKISNAFMLCFYNIDKMENLEDLRIVYTDVLGACLFFEAAKKQRKSRGKISPSVGEEYTLLKRALLVIRKRCEIYPIGHVLNEKRNSITKESSCEKSIPEKSQTPGPTQASVSENLCESKKYCFFLLYDMWRIFTTTLPVSSAVIDVLKYGAQHIEHLTHAEYDYLVKIRVKTLNKPIWENILLGCSKCDRAWVIQEGDEKTIYTRYITYLQELSEDVSLFLFDVLKEHSTIEEEEEEEIVDKMFFEEDGNIIYNFISWAPGVSLLRRKEYFDYLFEYLKKTDLQLLETVKANLRKQRFIV
ncbi:hypothetical protein NEAUS04_1667 [Nematocida ausubeli]|nr:hypothetical protein NEAUS04_1667 [Nematocida ausubeli]